MSMQSLVGVARLVHTEVQTEIAAVGINKPE
jgi:hypothetical protein